MKKNTLILILSIVFTSLFGCKSEYERLLKSNDSEKILETAEKYFSQEEYFKAQELYELALSSLKGKSQGEQVYFNYAQTFFHTKKFLLGSFYFNDFSNKFVHSKLKPEADFMNGYCQYQLSPSYRLDQTYTVKAIETFQKFVNRYPKHEKVEKCNELIAEMRKKLEKKAYAIGELYFNLRNYEAAIKSFEAVVTDFPDSDQVEKVFYMIAKSQFEYSNQSILTKQIERFEKTLEKCEDFNTKYEKSRYKKDIKNIIANCSKNIKDLKDAGYKD